MGKTIQLPCANFLYIEVGEGGAEEEYCQSIEDVIRSMSTNSGGMNAFEEVCIKAFFHGAVPGATLAWRCGWLICTSGTSFEIKA